MNRLLSLLRDVGSRYGAQVERVGKGAELRCTLERGHEELQARLVVERGALDIRGFLVADVPEGDGRFDLAPEAECEDMTTLLLERQMGLPDLDRLYVVHADDVGIEILRDCGEVLRVLAAAHAHVVLDGALLEIEGIRVALDDAALEPTLFAALRLWELCLTARTE